MRNKSGLMRDEKGQILIWVIALMMLAALIIPPFLASAYAGVHTSKVRQEKMKELYAADTGIEDALRWIISDGNITKPDLYDPDGNSTFPPGNSSTADTAEYRLSDWSDGEDGEWIPKLVNNCWVDVKVERDVRYYPEGNYTYFVYSTATNQDTGTHVKVRVHVTQGNLALPTIITPPPNVECPPCISEENWVFGVGSLMDGSVLNSKQGDITGDIYVNGPLNLVGGQHNIYGNVYSDGDLTLQQQSTIHGNVSASGNILLQEGAIIEQSAWGNQSITLDSSNGIYGNAYAQWDINVNTGSINGSAYANNDVNVLSAIHQSAWANNDINVNGGYIEGNASYLHSLNISGGGWVGNSKQLSQAITVPQPFLPQVAVPADPDAAYWGNASTGPTLPAQTIQGEKSLGPCFVQTSLQVKNNAKLILTGTVYVLGTVTVGNGGNITTGSPAPDTPAALVATDDITLGVNTFVGAQPGQDMILIMSVDGDITCENGSVIHAALYAPNGKIFLKNGSYVDGAVVAQQIVPEKKAGEEKKYTIVYNPEVQGMPGLPDVTMSCPCTPQEEPQDPYPGPDIIIPTGVNVDSYIVCWKDEASCWQ